MHSPQTSVLAVAILLTSGISVAQTAWTNQSLFGAPAPDGGSAYDSARGRAVAFGGQVGASQQAATREWDGSTWLTINTGGGPSARTRPAMAFDEARGVTVLFAGGNTFNNDTWTYDGTSWTQQSTASTPPVRFGAAMAYDAVRQVVVLFGGFVPSGQDTNDVWEWNGTNWTQRFPAGSQPLARGAHRMVFDETLGEVLLVGGFRTPINGTVSDVWSWNGNNWTQRQGLTTTRCDQAMVYDTGRQRTVLYGGANILSGARTQLSDTWEFFGGAWTQRTPLPAVGQRSSATVAYLPDSGSFLMAGGQTFPGVDANDTWTYQPVTLGQVGMFGQPCATSFGATLEATTLPYLGLPFTQELASPSPGAVLGLIIFGTSWQQYNGLPLPLDLASIGAPACFLQASVDVVNTVLLTNGAGELTWNIPNQPSATGFQFATQGVVFDPLSPLPLQVDVTSHLRCTIGGT